MFFFKKKKAIAEAEMTAFLKEQILYLHSLAEGKGFAKKGFIFNEGLLKLGEIWVKESLSAPFKSEMGRREFLYSIATSNLQTGMVFGRKCGLGINNIDKLMPEFDDWGKFMVELDELLSDDLGITFEQWDDFRSFIIPKWSEIMAPYENDSNKAGYEFRLLLAYYLLGVSIGIEKYE